MSQLYTVVIGISIVTYQVSLVVGVAWQHILLISAYNKYYNNHLQTAGAKSSQQEDREIALNKQLTICNNGIFDT